MGPAMYGGRRVRFNPMPKIQSYGEASADEYDVACATRLDAIRDFW